MSVELFVETTPDQRLLLDSAVRIMAAVCPSETVRELAETSAPADPALRRRLAELGCYGLLVEERHGGGSVSGNGVVDAAIIAAERGARLQPGPYVGTAVVAYALAGAGLVGPLERIVSGAEAATWAVAEPGAVAVRRGGAEPVLDGTLPAVQDADECARLLVSVPTPGGAAQYLVPLDAGGVRLDRRDGLDLTRRLHDIRLDGVRATPVEAPGGEPANGRLVERQRSIAAVLSAAETVGAMDADLRLAVDYAGTRVAFGRPIGSFQGVKHQLADLSLLLETSKGVVASAAESVGAGDPDGAAMASVAKAFVGERAVPLAQGCFQIFGGIGYTWEHDQHLYLRRLAAEAYLFGSPARHRDRLWDLSRDPDAVTRSSHA